MLYGLAVSHHQSGSTADAVAAYERCIEVDPNHIKARLGLSLLLQLLGRLVEAEVQYRQLLRLRGGVSHSADWGLSEVVSRQGLDSGGRSRPGSGRESPEQLRMSAEAQSYLGLKRPGSYTADKMSAEMSNTMHMAAQGALAGVKLMGSTGRARRGSMDRS